MIPKSIVALLATSLALSTAADLERPNGTYINPMIPGWASDPSCINVNGTFFCAVSTFVAFPGLPIYASRDLVNWKLISHAWNRQSQLPGIGETSIGQQRGMYAPNLRIHDGVFYCTCTYKEEDGGNLGTIFKTTDPFDDSSWSDPLIYDAASIDPDLFWDDDGTVYLTSAGIRQQIIDLETGDITEPVRIWNGTEGDKPEGPHIYKKDGYYYLLIAEGGTELGHYAAIARSKNVSGPWESNPANPLLTNENTTELYQTVGHADLFQDDEGQWWAAALATRSGPDWKIYPMGRESVLTAVTWDTGEWPVISPIRGIQSVWPLPPSSRDLPGEGPFTGDPDVFDFPSGSSLPKNFYFWRPPLSGEFATISPPGHDNTLCLSPLRANLTGIQSSNDTGLSGRSGIPFVGRRQTASLFSFSVDLASVPPSSGFEAGVSVFLTQLDHIDLGVTLDGEGGVPSFVFREYSTVTSHYNNYTNFTSTESTQPIPTTWSDQPLRLHIWTANIAHYALGVSLPEDSNSRMILGYSVAERVSGHSGLFTGTLLGVYNTCNGLATDENSTSCPEGGEAYFSRWRYEDVAQQVTMDELVPA